MDVSGISEFSNILDVVRLDRAADKGYTRRLEVGMRFVLVRSIRKALPGKR